MDAIFEQINSTGKAFINYAMPMLIQSSVLIIIFLVLDFLLRNRIRTVFRYWIWMIVLVKLMLPPTLSLPTSPSYWFGDKISHASYASETISPVDDNITSPYKNRYPQTYIATAGMVSSFYPDYYVPKLPVCPEITLSWQGMTLLIWLVVLTIMVILLIHQTFFVRHLIKQSQEADGNVKDILEQAHLLMKIRSNIDLRLSKTTLSPSVCGLLKPTVLIPKTLIEKLNTKDIKAILLHELAHIRRHDLWVSMIQAILQIIYIYNPLLWIANIVIRNIREQAVDEMVLVAMGQQAADYPETLLNISRYNFGLVAPSQRLIGVVESKKALYARIKHITSRPFPTSAKLGLSGILTIIIAAFIFLPMARAEKSFKTDRGTDSPLYARTTSKTPSAYELIRQAQAQKAEPNKPNQSVRIVQPDTPAKPAKPEETMNSVQPVKTQQNEAKTGERILHFPKDRPLGKLYIRMPNSGKDSGARLERGRIDNSEYLGEAQGDVSVPPDGQLTLLVDPKAAANLSVLDKLQPDDLYGIVFPYTGGNPAGATDTVMPHIARLTGLKSLELFSTNVTDAGMKHLVALKKIEHLTTSGRITDKGMIYVGQLLSLKYLELGGPSQVTDAGLQQVSKLTSLEGLALVGDRMGDEGLAHLRSLPQLSYLELQGTNFGDLGMVHLKQFQALKSLYFSEGKAFISDAGLADIAEIPNLEELSLDSRGEVTDAGLAHLVKLHSLKKLSLPGAHLTDKGCAYLKQIKTLEILEGSQGNQRITDVGLAHLSELPNLKSLSINYSYNSRDRKNPEPNPYGDKGLESLAKCHTLEELSIGSVAITDAGMEHLAKLNRLKKLTMLACINVTDVGITKLASLDQLENLSIDTANITVAGVNSLKTMSNLRNLSVYKGLKRNNTVLNISSLTNLETLGLICDASSEPFQDADLKCLSGLKHLIRLGLVARDFSDTGIAYLSSLTNLEAIAIGGSRLTDEGLKQLTNMKKLNSLQIFGGYNKNKSGAYGPFNITDKGLRFLEGFEDLTLLEILADGNFSDAVLRNLQQSHPNLIIRLNGTTFQGNK
jgi:beta-lactamase regulating signal transducer with metallopeptidase domain